MFCLQKLENWMMLWESTHIAFGNVPDSLHTSPQPWYVIMMVSILKMRTWSLGSFKLLVWGHPASRGCNHWRLFCLVWLTFSSASSCLPAKLRWESRMRPMIDLGSMLRDLGDLHATWSLFFLLPSLHWFYGFSPSWHFSSAPFRLLAPLCKYSSAQLICSCAFSSHVCLYLEPQPSSLTFTFLFLTALRAWTVQHQLKLNHE